MEEVLKRIGTIHQMDVPRDAVHIAVAPCIAAEKLNPGDRVTFAHKGDARTVRKYVEKMDCKSPDFLTPIGIVDPYLNYPVNKGDRFYVFLMPGSINHLRHEWSHAEFSAQMAKSPSEEWMRRYAEEMGLSYERMLEAGEEYLDHDEYVIDGGRYEGVSVPDEYWEHFSVLTGRGVPADQRGSFYSCSC